MSETIVLNENTPSVRYLCRKDRRLARVISLVGPITYESREEEPYSFLVHEIIEQMLSIRAGEKIFGRLRDACGGEVRPEAVAALSEEQIRGIGTSANKARCIREMTEKVLSGELDLKALHGMDDEAVMRTLTGLRGIGSWTAKMVMIFVLNRQDVLPYEDITFRQAFKWVWKNADLTPAALERQCAKWKPYRSIAARFLYRALDSGLTREPFRLFGPRGGADGGAQAEGGAQADGGAQAGENAAATAGGDGGAQDDGGAKAAGTAGGAGSAGADG